MRHTSMGIVDTRASLNALLATIPASSSRSTLRYGGNESSAA
jgi:hypothetical protein